MYKLNKRSFSQFHKLVSNEEMREKCLSSFKKSTNLVLEKSEKQAAVLIPICCVDENVGLLYTVRSVLQVICTVLMKVNNKKLMKNGKPWLITF